MAFGILLKTRKVRNKLANWDVLRVQVYQAMHMKIFSFMLRPLHRTEK